MTQVIEKAKELVKSLPLESLAAFAMTCPDEVLNIVLDELEVRMPESEFIELCGKL